MRENGYYWVIMYENEGWEVAYYYDGHWKINSDLIRDEYTYSWYTDKELIKINETRLKNPDGK